MTTPDKLLIDKAAPFDPLEWAKRSLAQCRPGDIKSRCFFSQMVHYYSMQAGPEYVI